MKIFGLSRKLLRLIRNCSSNIFCKIRYLEETSSSFEVKKGLRQGDAFSPEFFNLALERVIRETRNIKEMDVIGNNTLLAYADDIVIFGESKTDLISNTIDLVENSEKMGLIINENKTKYSIITRKLTSM